ncbi:N-acetylaspartylglutamate synthase A [Pelobates cultripes]|uniref:N-acetylaspartylglutamate synthase n=1 Tax=Pelobates cultripes TaxID=61616 RepID=A0AAD1TA30_PELCU|nr:N-acetylaspartylglutamate synthase A [Pelobates cultripes]
MGSKLWLLTDKYILGEYHQTKILEALKQRCRDQDVDFTLVLMDQIALTVIDGELGLQINKKIVTTYPQVIVVRVPTPTVQSDSGITVLRHLEKLGCRLVNRPQAILNCINKFWTFQELAGHGIPLPDTYSYGGHDEFSKMIDAAEPLGYPVVVKNTRGHQGKAVFLARDKHHLLDISHLMRHDTPYLFQKYVKESHGKDIRVVVVGGCIIGSMLRCSADGRMQSNCYLGGVGVKCSLNEQGRLLALQVSEILGMDVCGIDLLLKDNGSFVVCEANANVAFAEFDPACQLDLGSIIADYALSLLPSRLSKEIPLLDALPMSRETDEANMQASSTIRSSNDASSCCNSVSDGEEIRDSINVPKPCSPVLSDCIYDVDK